MALPAALARRMPASHRVELPGRGPLTVWDTDPASDLPVLVLLHGWNVDSGLNFASAIEALRADFRVILHDLHGHGAGHRSPARFRIEHCASDTLLLADHLGVDRFTPVGYSLGGAVAQVIARRAPRRCTGLILMATSSCYGETRAERARFAALDAAARAMRRSPMPLRRRVFDEIVERACASYPDWVNGVVGAADPVALLEAGGELRDFDSRSWIAELSMPAVMITTLHDEVVDPDRQRWLADNLSNSTSIDLAAGHDIPILDDPRFGATLYEAAVAVTGPGRPNVAD